MAYNISLICHLTNNNQMTDKVQRFSHMSLWTIMHGLCDWLCIQIDRVPPPTWQRGGHKRFCFAPGYPAFKNQQKFQWWTESVWERLDSNACRGSLHLWRGNTKSCLRGLNRWSHPFTHLWKGETIYFILFLSLLLMLLHFILSNAV